MAIRTLTTVPSFVLRQRTADISPAVLAEAETQRLIDDLIDTMQDADGIGIAAPQVGASVRICIVTTKAGPTVYVNPYVTRKSFRTDVMEEGCLSIPGIFGTVRRHKRLTLHALDRHGKPLKLRAHGMFARIIQHEVDHLDGVLFTDKVITYTKGERPQRT